MFTSISRGRVRFRSTYICTSCLAHIVPLPDPQSARQIQNRESFSTTSIHLEADKKDASNAQDKKSSGKRRRARLAAKDTTLISHSKTALAALKESLLAEETASKPPKSKPKSKKAKDLGVAEILQTISGAVKASPNAKTKSVVKAKEVATTPTKPKNPKKESKTAKKETPKITTTTASPIPAEDLLEVPKFRPGKKSKVPKPTDAQRRKINAVLLGAKKKRAAALGMKINNHIDAIGENEMREALVKIIEDGKLSTRKALVKAIKSDEVFKDAKVKATRKAKTLRIKRHLSGPLIRKFPSTAPPIFKNLQEQLTLKEAARRSLAARRSRPPRIVASTPSRPRRNKPGENVVTGPLKEGDGFEIKTLHAADLKLTPIVKPQPRVPNLSYGLDRVLFNPGVYQLQDPRSRVFNFDRYLQTIMPVSEFDFTALKKYITSSRDETLLSTARAENKKYTGSTSSTTAALGHFHFLLSQWRPVNTGILSQNFPVEFNSFTALQRGPSAIFLRWKDGVYAIDADKQFDTANILSTLGKSMEKLLTLSKEDFERYRKENSNQISLEEREADEAFNYTTMGDFLLRSQLDAHDARLPGTGMFDLKTRAVVSIRMDTSEYEQGMDYEIRQRYGEWESFEREYYDMIRAAFLKYSLQVRMGRMDGIFVAFHNTQRIFGFQYISLPEMDFALHGTEDTTIGNSEFKLSLELLNKVLDRATAKYPEKSLRLHFETRGTDVPFMYIFAEPMEDEQILEIQESNKAVIEEFEKRVLGLKPEVAESVEPEEELSEEEKKAAEWANMRARVEENMEKDELDIEEARALAESMVEGSEIFGSEAIEPEEKERLINELLESSAFSEVEDEEAMASREERDSEEDGVEGASADSEGDELDEDDDVGEEDEEENEEDEEGEENNEEEHEEDGEEEDMEQAEEDLDESGSLEEAGDEDLLVDETHPDNLTEEAGIEEPEFQAKAEKLLIDDAPTNELTEEPEIEATDDQVDNESTESVGEDHDETNTDADYITDSESVEADLAENQDLVPDDAVLDRDSQKPVSEESTTSTEADGENETFQPVSPDESSSRQGEYQDTTDVLAMTLTIRNKVNDRYVDRPKRLTSEDKWTIEYALEDVADPIRARKLYQACKKRRSNALSNAKRDDDNPWNNRYLENLRNLSREGKKWRTRQNEIDAEGLVKVLDSDQISKDQTDWEKGEKDQTTETKE